MSVAPNAAVPAIAAARATSTEFPNPWTNHRMARAMTAIPVPTAIPAISHCDLVNSFRHWIVADYTRGHSAAARAAMPERTASASSTTVAASPSTIQQ